VAEVLTCQLESVFKKIPPLVGFRVEDFQIHVLSGFTNQNIHLKNNEYDWVLRIPKSKTNQYINRQYEAHNADIANRLAIAPKCIWRDESGLSLTTTLLNTRSLNINDKNNKLIMCNLVDKICRLHNSLNSFKGTAEPSKLIMRYYERIPRHLKHKIGDHYKKVLSRLERLSGKDSLLVASHNDLVLENILIGTGGQVSIIDWEYSSMASPYWDLATLYNAANLDQNQSSWLLDEYKNQCSGLNPDILQDYCYLLQVLSICWMAVFTDMDTEQLIEKLNP